MEPTSHCNICYLNLNPIYSFIRTNCSEECNNAWISCEKCYRAWLMIRDSCPHCLAEDPTGETKIKKIKLIAFSGLVGITLSATAIFSFYKSK